MYFHPIIHVQYMASNGPDNLLSGVLDGSAGSVTNTTKGTRAPFETGLGSGVFAIGAPRSMEFGFKVSF